MGKSRNRGERVLELSRIQDNIFKSLDSFNKISDHLYIALGFFHNGSELYSKGRASIYSQLTHYLTVQYSLYDITFIHRL